ncbi:hypothetical protein Salat_1676100 [Sesamum alatum]|uniref:RNase H type-1 domain-containing protein n=1 Tax=Sesamum alatum TaxID=300844 RepID=A0AAE1Y6X7_9LAMI|nr:hypothetical protein Salat_1676100 [Sesamum alatum]
MRPPHVLGPNRGCFLSLRPQNMQNCWRCKRGLEFAHTHGWLNVIVESDYLQAILRLKSRAEDSSIHDNLVKAIRDRASTLPSCSFSHVCRTGNNAPHLVARSAFKFIILCIGPFSGYTMPFSIKK